jgi:hypothetical protein
MHHRSGYTWIFSPKETAIFASKTNFSGIRIPRNPLKNNGNLCRTQVARFRRREIVERALKNAIRRDDYHRRLSSSIPPTNVPLTLEYSAVPRKTLLDACMNL